MYQDNEMGFGKTILAALVAMVMFVVAFMITLPAFAEETQWPVWVVGFDFTKGEVVFEDEDGFIWSAPFGEHSWTVGEEYLLVLSENGAAIEEIEE